MTCAIESKAYQGSIWECLWQRRKMPPMPGAESVYIDTLGTLGEDIEKEEYLYIARELSEKNDSESERTAYRRSIAVLGKTFQTAENIRYEALSYYTIGLNYWHLGDDRFDHDPRRRFQGQPGPGGRRVVIAGFFFIVKRILSRSLLQ